MPPAAKKSMLQVFASMGGLIKPYQIEFLRRSLVRDTRRCWLHSCFWLRLIIMSRSSRRLGQLGAVVACLESRRQFCFDTVSRDCSHGMRIVEKLAYHLTWSISDKPWPASKLASGMRVQHNTTSRRGRGSDMHGCSATNRILPVTSAVSTLAQIRP